MTYALLALVIILVLLVVVMAWLLIEVLQRVDWLKNVLIPFMTSLSRFINPEKK